MSSATREREREEERRLSLRTLLIASAASATAAVITSRFWIAGTWVSAALTPVIVALVSELLHRPTEAVARRMTTERPAILPEAAGAAPPPPREEDSLPDRAFEAQRRGAPEPPVSVYRRAPSRRRRRIALGVVAITGVLAFAVAAFAITGTELVTGGSIGKGDRRTTLFGGSKGGSDETRTETTPGGQPATTTPGSSGGAQGKPQPQSGQKQKPGQGQQPPSKTTPQTTPTTPQTTSP